jgi:trans-aconitate 2-methyltransferase
MATWNPEQYERFAAERARPFHELVARIPTADAVAVVDLGCGPGTMTATLAARWPSAAILGIDSSPDMIAAAGPHATEQIAFRLADIATWRPAAGSVDVIVANASLQWVPGHLDLLTGWAKALDDGGTLAFQVPSAHDMPATSTVRELAISPAWAERLATVAGGTGPRAASPVRSPAQYVEVLAAADLEVDVWQTTYFHLLPGTDPVLEWFSGTGLRPYFDALAGDPPALADFRAEVAERLRLAYPPRDFGTILPFPRLFVVAARR